MANTGQPNTNGSQFFINQNSTDISAKLPTSIQRKSSVSKKVEIRAQTANTLYLVKSSMVWTLSRLPRLKR